MDVFLRFSSFLCISLSQLYRLIFNLADSFFCQLTCTVGTHCIMLLEYRTSIFLFIMSVFFFLLYKISFYLDFIICKILQFHFFLHICIIISLKFLFYIYYLSILIIVSIFHFSLFLSVSHFSLLIHFSHIFIVLLDTRCLDSILYQLRMLGFCISHDFPE